MSFIDGLKYRLRALLRRGEYEREMDDEIRHHLALDAQQTTSGDADESARRFGNVAYMKEETRRMSWLALADTIVQDVRFAVRTFARRRAFTAAALLTTGLGIGAATAIYSVADGVLFRPLPFPDDNRLVTVWRTQPELRSRPDMVDRWDHRPVSLPEYRDLRAAHRAFADIALYTSADISVTFDDEPEPLTGYLATTSLLPVLGVAPAIGRNFTEAEDQVGGAPVALVSYATWSSRYGSSPSVLSQSVIIDGKSYAIIGVLPKGLELGRGRSPGAFWIPAGQDAVRAGQRGYNDFLSLGRLAKGATLDAATAEAARVFADPGAQSIAASGPSPATTTRTQTNSHDSPGTPAGAFVSPWRVDQMRLARKAILILLGAAGLLLTIACVNVATLMLGEAAKRQQEMAARLALGAGRGRLVRQLLAESLTISLAGASLGVLLAAWGVRLLVNAAPGGIPGLNTVTVDARVLVAAGTVAVITGVLFGLAPALTLSSASTLTPRGRGVSGQGRGRLQQWFIGTQVALSVVLLAGAGLLGKSFAKLTAIDPGFNPSHLMQVNVSLPPTVYPDAPSQRAFLELAAERLSALPGVVGAGATAGWTFGSSNHTSNFQVEGQPVDPNRRQNAERRGVTPGFLPLAGVRLVAGREFSADDRPESPPVIVISQALARRAFGGQQPLGQRIVFLGQTRTVVGVAADVKFQRLSNDDPGTIYGPISQMCCFSYNLFARITGDPNTSAPTIRAAIKQIGPQVTVQGVAEMSRLVQNTYAQERYRTTLIVIFAAVSAVLAALGLYGVAARAVAQRVKEVAIRVALGATSASVVRLVLRRTLVGVAIGVGAGTIGALFATRVLTPYLFGVTATDPLTYGGIVLLLGLVSLAASWGPAFRATKVQPVEVLRED